MSYKISSSSNWMLVCRTVNVSMKVICFIFCATSGFMFAMSVFHWWQNVCTVPIYFYAMSKIYGRFWKLSNWSWASSYIVLSLISYQRWAAFDSKFSQKSNPYQINAMNSYSIVLFSTIESRNKFDLVQYLLRFHVIQMFIFIRFSLKLIIS